MEGHSDQIKDALSLNYGNVAEIKRARMEFCKDRFGRHEFDNGGTPALKAAAICDHMIQCANHMRKHPKDISGYVGLARLLKKRRDALLYVKRTEFDKYCDLLSFYKLKDIEDGMHYSHLRCARYRSN